MADVHVPDLDKPRHRPLVKIVLEVVLIATGVFLGLAGDQWRERAQHREMAEAALRRFRTEILANRKAVIAVKDYHSTTLKSLDAYLPADAAARKNLDVHIEGLRPAAIERTAWDLALATQSLADIDPQLGFALARIYTSQQAYAELTRGILQAMYLRPPNENLDAFLRSMALYYDDVVLMEPELVRRYDEVLPQLDHALGE
jgi:hypothetical protein